MWPSGLNYSHDQPRYLTITTANSVMASPSPTPTPTASTSTNRHVLTPVEKQRHQLEKLLKDPAKPAHVPAPPKEKTIRPPREMMKNIQGSSAGAGSGEFHVYKASRRREYERLKLIEETTKKACIATCYRVGLNKLTALLQ